MYPNLLAWYLQCYLDPEVAIYLEQCLFMDELIELILKNWGNLKVKGEQLLIYDDLATFGTSSWISLPVRNQVQVFISSRMKANSRSFPNITEASVDFGQNQVCLGDIVALVTQWMYWVTNAIRY